jgi:hypothetical protein
VQFDGAARLGFAAVVNVIARGAGSAESREGLMAQTSAAPGIAFVGLVQRNDARLRCIWFVLGIEAVDDYGRAPWNEGLY